MFQPLSAHLFLQGGRRGRQRKSKSREDESEEEDEEGGRRRRGTAKKRGAGADQNNGRGDYKGSEFKFKHDGEEDDSNKQGYHGNL